MVIPRSRSRSLESITQVGTASTFTEDARLLQQGHFDSELFLPWSTWALIAILRIGGAAFS